MKPDYKNWIPKGMMFSLIAGTALYRLRCCSFSSYSASV